MSVRVEGPAVDQLQGAFVSNWAETTGELRLGDRVCTFDAARDPARDDGPHTAGLMYSSPSLGSTTAEQFFFTSIAAARAVVPDERVPRPRPPRGSRVVRRRRAGRGRAGAHTRAHTDRPSTWYATRARYTELLEAGVQLYEYGPTMVHATSLVVDGVGGWSAR